RQSSHFGRAKVGTAKLGRAKLLLSRFIAAAARQEPRPPGSETASLLGQCRRELALVVARQVVLLAQTMENVHHDLPGRLSGALTIAAHQVQSGFQRLSILSAASQRLGVIEP